MTDFSSLIAPDNRTPEERVADQMLLDLSNDARQILLHYQRNYDAWWANPAADFDPQEVAVRLGTRGAPMFALVNAVVGLFAPDEVKAIPAKWAYTVSDDGTLVVSLAAQPQVNAPTSQDGTSSAGDK